MVFRQLVTKPLQNERNTKLNSIWKKGQFMDGTAQEAHKEIQLEAKNEYSNGMMGKSLYFTCLPEVNQESTSC